MLCRWKCLWPILCVAVLVTFSSYCAAPDPEQRAGAPAGSVALALATKGEPLTRVEAVVTDGGRAPPFSPLRAELSFVEDVATALVLGIPAGPGRGIAITAFEGDDPRCHGAAVVDVVVGDRVQVNVVLQCFGAGTDAGEVIVNGQFNHDPRIEAVVVSGTSVENGSTLDLHVTAFDPDGDRLDVFWSDGCGGSFAGAAAAGTTWTAPPPLAEGPCQMRVEVSDGRGGSASLEFSILVVAPSGQFGWQLISYQGGPARRTGLGLAYDPERRRALVFSGGENYDPTLADTWEWDGERWQQLFPEHAPPPLVGHALVFDPARREGVLFGGLTDVPSLRVQGRSWLWDGADWWEALPQVSPTARVHHAMAYDEAREVVVLFGGQSDLGFAAPPLGDTWEWNGSSWTRHFPAHSPAPRARHAMVFDPRLGGVLLVGGRLGQQAASAESWLWDGQDWTLLTDGPLGERFDHDLVWDPRGGRVALVRGHFFSPRDGSLAARWDVWEWDGAHWALSPDDPLPPATGEFGLFFDRVRGVTLLYGGRMGGRPSAQLWERVPLLE